MDVVAYSTLLIDAQTRVLADLNRMVRETRGFREGEVDGKLLCLPTGDGMALVFFDDPEAPIECATEISAAIKSHPDIRLRMGIHSGPVNEVIDVNDRSNLAGAGIDMAQRVMDCGDAGSHSALQTCRRTISRPFRDGTRICMISANAR